MELCNQILAVEAHDVMPVIEGIEDARQFTAEAPQRILHVVVTSSALVQNHEQAVGLVFALSMLDV